MKSDCHKTIPQLIFKTVPLFCVILGLQIVAAAQDLRLEGMWDMYNDANAKFDKPAKIDQSGGKLLIDNGYGANSTGVLEGNTLRTSDGLTGTVSPDGNRITWSIGYVWIKIGSPTRPAFDLNGNWVMSKPNGETFEKHAVVTQTGASVTLDNGYGSRTTVELNGSKLAVTAWNLTGNISADGGQIDWSNGVIWVKNKFVNRVETDSLEVQEEKQRKTSPADTRTLTLKNGGAINVTVNLYRADRPKYDNTPVKSIKWIDGGASPSVNFGGDLQPGTELEAEITMKVGGLGQTWNIPIYRAIISASSANLCFEVGGTAYKAWAKPCGNTQAVELDYVTLRNDAGFMANMKLDYTAETGVDVTTQKSVTTDDTLLGFERKIYVPRDSVGYEMTLKINMLGITSGSLLTKILKTGTKISDCYKVWGDMSYPKISPCSVGDSPRTIKFWNNSGVMAKMEVSYDAKENVSTNFISLTQSETIGIPASKSKAGIKLKFIWRASDEKDKEITTTTVPYDFTGELCYKVEGAIDIPSVATCDDVVGDSFGETRRIRFQNEAGYDAQMIVLYYADEKINGVTVAMPKTLTTGLINGLGGKFRVVAIPKNTSKGLPVTIMLQGNSTLKNAIWNTTLPADFTDSPQPCFKVWGTLFDPQGAKCKE